MDEDFIGLQYQMMGKAFDFKAKTENIEEVA
jgi:hypothetical protein